MPKPDRLGCVATVRTLSLPALGTALAMMLSVAAFERWHEVAEVPPSTSLVGFPTSLGRWRFIGEVPLSPAVREIGFDHAFTRRYMTPEGYEVELLVGYFERQRQAHELAGFQLSRLLLGDTGRPFTLDLNGAGRVRDFLTTANGHPYHITYWYVLNGRIAFHDYQAKWWTMWDSLVRRRSNGGIVMVRARVPSGESLEASRSRTRDLIEALLSRSKDSPPES